jgi:phosphate transport system protein
MDVRQAYAQELQDLEREVIAMASLAEAMVAQAIESICLLDVEMARGVLNQDDTVDRIELAVESHCMRLIGLQQPTGTDLRVIAAVLKIVTDVERVGDLACDIAKCGMKIEKEMGVSGFIDMRRIGNVARSMVLEAIEAFVKRDLGRIESIESKEEEVDALYRDLRGQIHRFMTERPDQVVSASWMLLALHHVERIADHAINIAERVSFMVTGRFEPLARHRPQAS